MIALYDLASGDGRRFSPYCWRTQLALAHKGLSYNTIPCRFGDIAAIPAGQQKTVPAIADQGRIIGDSWAIAKYLEETYPDRPSLFGGEVGMALTFFLQNWVVSVLHPQILTLILRDIHDRLDETDRAYFRASREKRFGRAIEAVQEGREKRVEDVRKLMQPLRLVLAEQPWFSGAQPLYADYIVFGALQWPRIISDFPVLATDDPLSPWFERCLDLFGGIGRRAFPFGGHL